MECGVFVSVNVKIAYGSLCVSRGRHHAHDQVSKANYLAVIDRERVASEFSAPTRLVNVDVWDRGAVGPAKKGTTRAMPSGRVPRVNID